MIILHPDNVYVNKNILQIAPQTLFRSMKKTGLPWPKSLTVLHFCIIITLWPLTFRLHKNPVLFMLFSAPYQLLVRSVRSRYAFIYPLICFYFYILTIYPLSYPLSGSYLLLISFLSPSAFFLQLQKSRSIFSSSSFPSALMPWERRIISSSGSVSTGVSVILTGRSYPCSKTATKPL